MKGSCHCLIWVLEDNGKNRVVSLSPITHTLMANVKVEDIGVENMRGRGLS